MLEWTICTKCGKVLDNSKDICPSCNSETKKLNMDFLKNHGQFDFSNKDFGH